MKKFAGLLVVLLLASSTYVLAIGNGHQPGWFNGSDKRHGHPGNPNWTHGWGWKVRNWTHPHPPFWIRKKVVFNITDSDAQNLSVALNTVEKERLVARRLLVLFELKKLKMEYGLRVNGTKGANVTVGFQKNASLVDADVVSLRMEYRLLTSEGCLLRSILLLSNTSYGGVVPAFGGSFDVSINSTFPNAKEFLNETGISPVLLWILETNKENVKMYQAFSASAESEDAREVYGFLSYETAKESLEVISIFESQNVSSPVVEQYKAFFEGVIKSTDKKDFEKLERFSNCAYLVRFVLPKDSIVFPYRGQSIIICLRGLPKGLLHRILVGFHSGWETLAIPVPI